MPLLVERNVYSLYWENKLKVSNIFEDKGEELVLLQRNGGKLQTSNTSKPRNWWTHLAIGD